MVIQQAGGRGSSGGGRERYISGDEIEPVPSICSSIPSQQALPSSSTCWPPADLVDPSGVKRIGLESLLRLIPSVLTAHVTVGT
jgi:hypothetical protein